jgi:ABC-type Mn2+/Zn2+ transport system permease subunit
MENNILFLIIVGAFVGAASGYLGSFMVLKRMSLVGDALSHVALPGMAIAIALNFSPILGALIALTIAVIGIWYFSETSSVYPEALVGVFFTASLAIGILITPEPDLLEALFGNIEKITLIEGLFAIFLTLLIILITRSISKSLILGVVSEELVKSLGISNRKVNLIYLLLVGAIVALGVKFVGTLLMGALVIIPAVSAKNVSRGINSYYLLSVLFGVMSSLIGAIVANIFSLSTGPTVVIISILIFLTTYLVKAISLKN